MKPDNNGIFVDTSFWKALGDPKDDFHKESKNIWAKIELNRSLIITSNYILDETYTLVRKRCGMDLLLNLKKGILDSQIVKVVRVTASDERSGWKWFQNKWSGLSFTDCVTFALMKRLDLKRVATFDQHFEKAGFQVEN